LVAATLTVTLAGGFVAVQIVSESTGAYVADDRVPTSFGALRVDSVREIATPKIVRMGHVGIPQPGNPDQVALEVAVSLANTTGVPVD
jgi:hypothetical protein